MEGLSDPMQGAECVLLTGGHWAEFLYRGGGRIPHSCFRKNNSRVEFGNRKTVRWPLSDVPDT